jgi:cytochrome P450
MEVYQQDTDGLNQQRPNFLDLMLQMKDSEKLSEKELREETDTIMFAGHDTTSHAVSWALWCFASNPEIQQRVFEELQQNFGDSDSEFCTSRLKDLKYFDQCFKEVLRLFPPVPAVQRFVKHEMQMCGFTIPRLTSLTIPIILLHRNPRVSDFCGA